MHLSVSCVEASHPSVVYIAPLDGARSSVFRGKNSKQSE